MSQVKDYYCHNCGLFQVGRERCRECGSLDVAYVSDPVPIKRDTRALEAIDSIERITHDARKGSRHGVTEREAKLYDKGFDDALDLVRSALALREAG